MDWIGVFKGTGAHRAARGRREGALGAGLAWERAPTWGRWSIQHAATRHQGGLRRAAYAVTKLSGLYDRLGSTRTGVGADLGRTHAPTTARFPTPSPPSPAFRRIRAGLCSTISTLSQLPLLTWAGLANQTSPPPFDPFLPTPIRTTRHPTRHTSRPRLTPPKPTAPDQ